MNWRGGVTYDKAEGEPRILLDHMAAIISTVVTSADDALVALYLLAEGVLAARKYDTHGRVRL